MRIHLPAAATLLFGITACAGVIAIGEGPQRPFVVSIQSPIRVPAAMPVHCPASVPFMPVARGRDADPRMPRGRLAPSPCRDAVSQLGTAVLLPDDSAAIVKPAAMGKVRSGVVPR